MHSSWHTRDLTEERLIGYSRNNPTGSNFSWALLLTIFCLRHSKIPDSASAPMEVDDGLPLGFLGVPSYTPPPKRTKEKGKFSRHKLLNFSSRSSVFDWVLIVLLISKTALGNAHSITLQTSDFEVIPLLLAIGLLNTYLLLLCKPTLQPSCQRTSKTCFHLRRLALCRQRSQSAQTRPNITEVNLQFSSFSITYTFVDYERKSQWMANPST